MPNRGQWGALEGLGKGVSGAGDSIRERWIMASQQDLELKKESRATTEWERRNKVGNEQDIARDTARTGAASKLEDQRSANDIKENYEEVRTWRVGEYAYKIDKNKTFVLQPGSATWEPIGEAGSGSSLLSDPEDRQFEADDYADERVKELAGFWSLDKSDFSEFGGSRESARQHFRKEYLDGNAGTGLDSPPSSATEGGGSGVGADLDTRPVSTTPPAGGGTPEEASAPGGTGNRAKIDGILEKNKNMEFVQRILDPSLNPEPLDIGGQSGSHLMSAEVDEDGLYGEPGNWYAFPTIINENGKLVQYEAREAMKKNKERGELISFGKDRDSAIDFSKNYKTEEFKNYFQGQRTPGGDKSSVAEQAKAAISGGAPRNAVIARLKQNGFTDQEIQQYGI